MPRELPGLTPIGAGKVRDLYAVDDTRVVLVASDRISTYDHVHPTPVPDKGRVLTALSAFWFGQLAEVVAGHLISTAVEDLPAATRPAHDELRGRIMLCHRVEIVPFECVVRGYLAGSGWQEYRRDGRVCGQALPSGLRESDRLPAPIFTPATKAPRGRHDENVSFARMAAEIGPQLAGTLRERSLEIYRRAASHAEARGILLADTKLEFGLMDGEVVLADEVLTPDSSRYWPAEHWEPGRVPPSFDKQYVRDHVTRAGWDRTAPAPALTAEVVAATRERYVRVYEQLTGRRFADWTG